jgi:hypothetical protein
MNKQEPFSFPLSDPMKGMRYMNNRYYVQRLTEQIFLVRERLSVDGAPSADDRIIRSFQILHDASLYTNSLNETKRTRQNVVVPECDTHAKKQLHIAQR